MKFLFKSLASAAILTLFGIAGFAYAQIPQVITEGTTDRYERGVTLQGAVNLTNEYPFGGVLFEYGRTANYGNTTARQNVTESGSFEQTIGGLNPNRGYNFRAVLIASDGQEYYGENKTFITTSDNIENPGQPPQRDDQSGDSQEETDTDGDGIPDSVECPGIEDGALCPDTDDDGRTDNNDEDSDGDGIPDSEDENRTDPFNSNGDAGSESGDTEGTGVTVGDPISVGGGGLIVQDPNIIPTGTRAEGEMDTRQLVPCGNKFDADGKVVNPCTFTDLVELAERVINILIYLTIFASVVTFIWVGFIFMTKGDIQTARTDAKRMAKNAGIGLLLTLFAWLIVTSMLALLTNTDDGDGNTNTDRFLQQ